MRLIRLAYEPKSLLNGQTNLCSVEIYIRLLDSHLLGAPNKGDLVSSTICSRSVIAKLDPVEQMRRTNTSQLFLNLPTKINC